MYGGKTILLLDHNELAYCCEILFFFSCVTRLYPPHFTHICNLFHKIFRFFAKFNDNLVHVD